MKNIIFDLGGVLIHWDPKKLYKRYFNNDHNKIDHFFEETNIMKANAEMDRGKPFQEAIDELSEKFPHYNEPLQLWKTEWLNMIGGPITESVKILKSLNKEGYPLYALTNWSEEKFFPHIRHQPEYSFLDLFKDIVVSGVEKEIKPEPRIYEILLERNDLDPKSCIYIDDAPCNLVPAEKLGMSTIHFKSPEQLANELQQNIDQI